MIERLILPICALNPLCPVSPRVIPVISGPTNAAQIPVTICERDNATLLAKPEQQRTQGDQQTEQRQNGTFVLVVSVMNPAGSVARSPARPPAVISKPMSSGVQCRCVRKIPKRTETVTDVSDKTRQAQRPQ